MGLRTMTTDLATYPETVGASFSRPDPVRSRVKYEQPLTNYEKQHPFVFEETPAKTFRIPLPEFKLPTFAFKAPSADVNQVSDTDRPRRPHPGDVFYWITCLGGVCLLLLAATR
jgi:hypothetical protein